MELSRLYCLERPGDAPAVLCVHGYCQSSAYWAPTLERLAETGARGLAPDLPGFGASAGHPGPYTMEAYADVIADMPAVGFANPKSSSFAPDLVNIMFPGLRSR